MQEQQEYIQCTRCHRIINDKEDYQLVAIFNGFQYALPLCVECADDYNDMYEIMLVRFLETERDNHVDTGECN